jgi:membrane-anchored protein YejM (alkaline phosphatase superfamily)
VKILDIENIRYHIWCLKFDIKITQLMQDLRRKEQLRVQVTSTRVLRVSSERQMNENNGVDFAKNSRYHLIQIQVVLVPNLKLESYTLSFQNSSKT